MHSILSSSLNNVSFCHTLGQYDTFVIVLQTCEDFVGTSIEQPNKSHPFFFVILETNDITFQYIGALLHHFRGLAILSLFLFLLANAYHNARATSISINRTPFAAATPSLHIEAVNKGFINIVRKIHSNRYTVVHPLLNLSLH